MTRIPQREHLRDATRIHIVGRQERRHSLGIGGGVDADNFDFLAASSIGFPSAANSAAR